MNQFAVTSLMRKMATAFLCALVAVMLALPTAAFADTAAEKQAEAEEALAQLNAMQESLDRASADYGEALAAQEAAEAARDEARERLVQIEKQLDLLQQQLNARARGMYRQGGISVFEVLLGSTSFEEFATNWDLLTRVGESDAELVEQQKILRLQAAEQKAIAEEQAKIAAQKSAEAAEVQAQAEATVAEMQEIYDNLSAEAARLLEEERRAQEEAERARMQAVIEAAAASGAENGGDDYGYDFSNDNTISADVAYEGGYDTVSRAYACLGAPYGWGAVGPSSYDCSGLVSYCLSGAHIRLGTTYTFMGWPQVSDPQPGDICTNWSHCGIYIGGGQMIHAADYGIGVIIGPVQAGMIIVRY